jgi:hypothetical protein
VVYNNPYLLLNSVDLTLKIRSLDVSFDVAKVDKTCGNSGGMKGVEAGLEGATMKLKCAQGFGTGSVHATLLAAHKTLVAFEFRPTSAAVSTTNPKLTGTCLVLYQSPGGGAIGSELEADAELTVDGAYTWATS